MSPSEPAPSSRATPSKVFVSYSHDSPEHADRVLALADRLRAGGVDAVIDQYEPHPPEGWPRWMARQIREAEFVLLVCTETYCRRVDDKEEPGVGRGVCWEANLIFNELYNAQTVSGKFVPVLFADGDAAHIPAPLQGHTHYRMDGEEGCEELYRRLTHQPKVGKPEMGPMRTLPKRQRAPEYDTPQWRGLFMVPHNLPAAPDAFVGRDREVQRIVEELRSGRLLTVRGGPGVGKTALAVAAGHHINERRMFRNGVFFVDLREVRSAEAARSALASALGIAAPNDAALLAALRARHCLLIWDNAEVPLHHTPSEFRQFLSQLLQQAPGVKMLLASRQAVGGALPGVAERVLALQSLPEDDASHLFTALSPRRLSPQEVRNLRPVLGFLAGNPGAISLAAPVLQDRSVQQLQQLLKTQTVDALVVAGIPADEQDAATSFARSIGASVDRLRERLPEAVRLFGMMGLLPSGALSADLDAGWGDGWRGLMDELVRTSLADRAELNAAEPNVVEHFSTAPFITAFAERELGAADRIQFSHLLNDHLALFATEIYAQMGSEHAMRARWLFGLQEGNLWACLSPDRVAEPKREGRGMSASGAVAACLSWILLLFDRLDDAARAAQAGLGACRQVGDHLGEAYALKGLGDHGMRLGDVGVARERYEEALSLSRKARDRVGQATALHALGDLMARRGDLEQARTNYEAALQMSQGHPDRRSELNVLQSIGLLRLHEGDLRGAGEAYEAALLVSEQGKHWLGKANILQSLGTMKQRMNDPEGAAECYKKAAELQCHLGNRMGEANAHWRMAELQLQWGDWAAARAGGRQALALYRTANDYTGKANALRLLGDVWALQGRRTGAARRYETALAIFRRMQDPQGEANTSKSLGDLRLQEGNLADAGQCYEAALGLFRRMQEPLGEANVLQARGELRRMAGDTAGAATDFEAALDLFRRIRDRIGEANTLSSRAALRGATGDREGAQQDYEAARAIFFEIRHWRRTADVERALEELRLDESGRERQGAEGSDANERLG